MLAYIGVAAIMAATLNVQGALELVVFILSSLALMFYIVAFKLFAGLSQSVMTDGVNILQVITIYMIYITMATVAFMGGYQLPVYVALPWLVIRGFINVLSILIKLDIIGIKHK